MLDPAVTIHVANTHAGDSMVLTKDSRWQSPTSIERYASNLSLWLSGTKDMLVHTLSCMHPAYSMTRLRIGDVADD